MSGWGSVCQEITQLGEDSVGKVSIGEGSVREDQRNYTFFEDS